MSTRAQFIDAVLGHWQAVLGVVCIAYLARTYFYHGLNRYPGPWLAKFTNAWRVYDVSRNHHQHTLIELHKKYGPVVRTGPNVVDIADPELIPAIYGVRTHHTKSDFYLPFNPLVKGKIVAGVFQTQDEKQHSAMKRPVTGMYSLSTVATYEPLVDQIIRLFVDRVTAEFSDKSKACNIADWLHYMAFDLILHLTFGSSLGFLNHGSDVDGLMEMQRASMGWISLASQMPALRYLHRHNPFLLLKKNHSNFGVTFVLPRLIEHQRRLAQQQKTKVSHGNAGDGSNIGEYGDDFITRFLQHPGMNESDAVMFGIANLMAGADTTAISLRATVYLLLKNPAKLQRLMQELREHDLSYPVTWKESQQLPYLIAVVHEALRLHSAVGLSLERKVPDTGLQMPDGTTLPAGTLVGMNAWVVHRTPAVYGDDADVFRPERWLRAEGEEEASFERRLTAMKKADMAFGYTGSKRVCLGRNISYLEIYKLIPTLFLEFDLTLVNPEKEWKTENRFFVRQFDMDVWVKRRGR